MARSVFGRLKAEGERIALPNECEENDRAVRFLAKETGVGHYDNINLLIMAVLFIFVAVAFLAVNGGKAGSSRMKAVTKESLMNGEFTTELEKSYLDQLPIPDEIKRANEVVSLLYGFGNKLTSTKHRSFSTGNDNSGTSQNVFDRDDDDKDHKENAVTMGTQTDENGNVMTTEEVVKTAPGGGTTAVARTDAAVNSSAAVSTQPGETTTTNNDAPVVTTTTTTVGRHARSETQSSTSSTTESSVTTQEPIDISEPDVPTDTMEPVPSQPEPSDTEPQEPDITDPFADEPI